MKVYLASMFANAPACDTTIRAALNARGLDVGSSWHRPPWRAREGLDAMPLAKVQDIAAINDHELAVANAVFVITEPLTPEAIELDARPGETLCEARIAWSIGLPLVWFGPRVLTAYRVGVTCVDSIEQGVDALLAIERQTLTPAAARIVDLTRDVPIDQQRIAMVRAAVARVGES